MILKASWAELKIKINNTKNDVTSTVKLALHQDLQDLVLKTSNRQVKEDGIKRFYLWRSIMKAVTFYFRNLESTQSIRRFVLPFLIFMVDLTFGKILNI